MPDANEIRDYLLPFFDTDDPIVIRMRHEPHEAAARLLASLGAGWIVDEFAPPCLRSCGQKECLVVKDVSAHDLTRTRFCVEPICPEDAIAGSDRCRAHTVEAQQPKQRKVRSDRIWTEDVIVAAICRWADEHDGDAPTQAAWRNRGDYWPPFSTAAKVFGTWGAALAAAGLQPKRSGGPALREVAGARSDEAVQPAASLNVRTIRLRVIQRVAAIREEIDAMERELLDALEEEAA